MTVSIHKSQFDKIVKTAQKGIPEKERATVTNLQVMVPVHHARDEETGFSNLLYVQEVVVSEPDPMPEGDRTQQE